MNIIPKQGVLLVKRHTQTALTTDLAVEENEEDKTMQTGTVISNNSSLYPQNTTVIFGKYALFTINIKGEISQLLNEDDVVGTTDYIE